MEVGWPGGASQRWIARVGNRAGEPLPLDEAKRAAVAMLRERRETEPHDWIVELNKIAAAEVERAAHAEDRKRLPTDILGGARHGSIDSQTRALIIGAELDHETPLAPALRGDDCALEYYANGYPKLPACFAKSRGAAGSSGGAHG